MDEQRSVKRIGCSLTVQVHAPSQDVLLFTYATNISVGGLYVRANRLLPVGTQVRLDLQPEKFVSDRVSLYGSVVRTNQEFQRGPRGMGIAFASTEAEDASFEARMKQLVSRLEIHAPVAKNEGMTATVAFT